MTEDERFNAHLDMMLQKQMLHRVGDNDYVIHPDFVAEVVRWQETGLDWGNAIVTAVINILVVATTEEIESAVGMLSAFEPFKTVLYAMDSVDR